MRILAIDPGYERLGIAILEKTQSTKETIVYSDCFHTSIKESHPKRLNLIAQEVVRIIEEYKPTALAIETLFFSANKKTALLVAEARGALLATCVQSGLQVFEYSPAHIKIAVTGYGKSDKKQVVFMVKKLTRFEKDALDDEYDAIAIGLTLFATERFLFL
jgi:crossover junction endodeoxyribonuclease RuvC